MQKKFSRRKFINTFSKGVALPFLDVNFWLTREALAQDAGLANFIGVFFPNGAYMPNGANGDFTWNGCLKTLMDAGLQNQSAIFRNVYNGIPGIDPHWQNAASFLSAGKIKIGPGRPVECAKSLDQFIADKSSAPVRSLQLGGLYYHRHPDASHNQYSMAYLNHIAWHNKDTPLTPIPDPHAAFKKLFGGVNLDPVMTHAVLDRNKSILDFALNSARDTKNKVGREAKLKIDEYMQSIRDTEKALTNVNPDHGVCSVKPQAPESIPRSPDPNIRYEERMKSLNSVLVTALKCQITNVATIMLAPSISSNLNYGGKDHHWVAHHPEENKSHLYAINRIHMALVSDLINKLKREGLFSKTLVMAGSDMSDGAIHKQDNLPIIVSSGASSVNLSNNEINEGRRPISDLLTTIARKYGVTHTFGVDSIAFSGRLYGI